MREKLNSYLQVRVTDEEKEKLKIVSRANGIPNMSIYIREIIKDKIEDFEINNGEISIETRKNEEGEI